MIYRSGAVSSTNIIFYAMRVIIYVLSLTPSLCLSIPIFIHIKKRSKNKTLEKFDYISTIDFQHYTLLHVILSYFLIRLSKGKLAKLMF